MGCKVLFYFRRQGWGIRLLVSEATAGFKLGSQFLDLSSQRFRLLGAIPMHDLDPVASFSQTLADLFADHYGAMLAAGAAERDGQIAFSFPDVMRQ